MVGQLGREGELAGVDRHSECLRVDRRRSCGARSRAEAVGRRGDRQPAARARFGDDQRDHLVAGESADREPAVGVGRRAERERRPDQVEPVVGSQAVVIGPAERVDAGDLDLRPDHRLAARLDDPAADDSLRPELQRDRACAGSEA